jgi:hypothetical protein
MGLTSNKNFITTNAGVHAAAAVQQAASAIAGQAAKAAQPVQQAASTNNATKLIMVHGPAASRRSRSSG